MDQRLTFVTIGVKDLETAKRFYTEKFEWKPLKDSDGIVFFKTGGTIFALFPAHELAADAGIEGEGSGFKRMTLAVNYDSEEEVDQVFAQLRQKGVHVVKTPQKLFWGGYSGYVEDAEHNLWEIAFNPFLEMDEEGNVITHR